MASRSTDRPSLLPHPFARVVGRLLPAVALALAAPGCATRPALGDCERQASSSSSVVGHVDAPGGEPARWPAEAARFEVLALEPVEARDPIRVVEAPFHVEISSPSFYVYADIACHTEASEGWAVGFVQAVTGREQANEYPSSTTTWELDPLPLSDSDGTYPWYSQTAHVRNCNGQARIYFDDAPSTTVPWREWHPDPDRNDLGQLERYHRHQTFRVWLVALHVATGRTIVLKELDWRFDIAVAFDTTRPVGSRARVERSDFPATVVRDGDPTRPLPRELLRPPRANDADTLWWAPKNPADGRRTMIVAPAWGPTL